MDRNYETSYHCKTKEDVVYAVNNRLEFTSEDPLLVKGYCTITAQTGESFYVMAYSQTIRNDLIPALVYSYATKNWYIRAGMNPSSAMKQLLDSLPQDKLVPIPGENPLKTLIKHGLVTCLAEVVNDSEE